MGAEEGVVAGAGTAAGWGLGAVTRVGEERMGTVVGTWEFWVGAASTCKGAGGSFRAGTMVDAELWESKAGI